jgi:phage terminase large subunit-like protein
VGAEEVVDYGISHPGERIAVIAPTSDDVQSVCFEGESGILASLPAFCRKGYNSTRHKLILPNGAIIRGYSAEEPNRLRGPQHHFGWCDEICAWKRPETWAMFMLGLRLGEDPRVVITTTPKPVPLTLELIRDPRTKITRGTTYENRANLAPSFFTEIITKYEGTRLGRQELLAEVLTDVPGALWTLTRLDQLRILPPAKPPEMQRIVVAIDPAGSMSDAGDEIGIGAAGKGVDGHGYVLEDASCRLKPLGWAARAIALYHKWEADAIVAETNYGGAMVESTLHTVDPNVRVIQVSASRGKAVRAEPTSALYEQGRFHHVGSFAELEEQMCALTPSGYGLNGSPDRVDWLVWASTELFQAMPNQGIFEYYRQEAQAVEDRKRAERETDEKRKRGGE